MGNSYCCIASEKGQQFIIQSEYMVESIENINEKELNYNNLNLKNDCYRKKTTSTLSPQMKEDNVFINPLPEIVIIKRNKNKH